MLRARFLSCLGSIAVVAAMGIPSSGLAQPTLGDDTWNYELILGGGSATGNSRILVSALGKILTENVKGVRATGAVVPGYDAESAIHTHAGTMHGGVGTPLIIKNAIEGKEPFPKEGIDLKFWFYHNEVPLNILAQKAAGISYIDELAGKTVALAPVGTCCRKLSLRPTASRWKILKSGTWTRLKRYLSFRTDTSTRYHTSAITVAPSLSCQRRGTSSYSNPGIKPYLPSKRLSHGPGRSSGRSKSGILSLRCQAEGWFSLRPSSCSYRGSCPPI